MNEEIYKDYKIVTVNNFLMKEIKAVGRGSVPKELRGYYTSSAQAKHGIDAFLSLKEIPDGKAKSTS